MRTLDNAAVPSHRFLARLTRDLRLIKRIAAMLYHYFHTGRTIRGVYREKEAQGQIYYVDEAARGGPYYWQREKR